MVATAVGARTLDRGEILDILHHAHLAGAAFVVGADGTLFLLRQISADSTAAHFLRRLLKRGNQLRQPRWFLDEQVQGNALSLAIADARQLLQLLLQKFESGGHEILVTDCTDGHGSNQTPSVILSAAKNPSADSHPNDTLDPSLCSG